MGTVIFCKYHQLFLAAYSIYNLNTINIELPFPNKNDYAFGRKIQQPAIC